MPDHNETVKFGTESLIKSITLEFRESRDNGSPCDIRIERQATYERAETAHSRGSFAAAVEKMIQAVNATPDNYPKNHAEMTEKERDNLHPDISNPIGRHMSPGDEDCRFVDAIAFKNLRNVAAKAIRALYEEGALSAEDVVKAHMELKLPHASAEILARRGQASNAR